MVVKGILYYQDKPQVHLNVDTVDDVYSHTALNDKPILPYEFHIMGINKDSFKLFLEDRVMPSTRQSKRSMLEWAGIPFYSVELIAQHNYFCSCNDSFWIKPDDEGITWEQVQKI